MLSKKKARRIVVDDREYFWLAIGDTDIKLFVERDIPGSPKLSCHFDYGSGAKQVAITPSVARRAILRARELGWNPEAPGKDLRLRPYAHKLDIHLDRIRHFYRTYEALKPVLHSDYENIPDPLVDIETITDNLWSLDAGDEFWRSAIDVLSHEYGKDTAFLESRLASAHAVEVDGAGYICAFISRDRQLLVSASAYYGQPTLQLGANDARTLAHGLRRIASVKDVSTDPPTTSEWLPARGEVYLELPFLEGLQLLSPQRARQLAQRLLDLSHDIPAESPPAPWRRHPPP